MGSFYVKVHNTLEGGTIIYACDSELLGKRFSEKGLVLDISVEMYGGELLEEDELLPVIMSSSSFTVVGKRIVRVLIERKLIHPEAVLRIAGIPYAMFINTL